MALKTAIHRFFDKVVKAEAIKPMYPIQIDMFEVQLGAGLLLQFKLASGRTLRILADAGVHATGYSLDHVHDKLVKLFNESDASNSKRLDLVVGTHYDADHLDGLVPIIDDKSISIGEAWLPPVANDTQHYAVADIPEDQNLLANQFAAEGGPEALEAYLQEKSAACEHLHNLESMGHQLLDPNGTRRELQRQEFGPIPKFRGEDSSFNFPDVQTYFKKHWEAAAAQLGGDLTHAGTTVDPPEALEPVDVHFRTLNPWFRFEDIGHALESRWREYPGFARTEVASLAYIRRAAAADAINATSLYQVVISLKRRKIPIRCQIISNGQPRYFYWDAGNERFVPQAQHPSDDPELVLLAPSQGLVKRHWQRLPIGHYSYLAAFTRVPVKSITPSNQLSYVLRIGFKEQGILVTGDAGCVDFRESKSKQFYPALLKTLNPLHVVQVAHHGGNNAEFYNVLGAANYLVQQAPTFLLLSHATRDRFRPSEVLAQFLEQVPRGQDNPHLLFTSEPLPDKVQDFRRLINPPVPAGYSNTVGDVRLAYDGKWRVLRHAISV